LKQGFRVRRWGIRKGKAYEEVVHGITSLPLEKADAKRLLELVRGHWQIENPQPDNWRSDNLCDAGGTGYHRT
jgi:hypothetical protein